MRGFDVRFGADQRWIHWSGRWPAIVRNANDALIALGVKQ